VFYEAGGDTLRETFGGYVTPRGGKSTSDLGEEKEGKRGDKRFFL